MGVHSDNEYKPASGMWDDLAAASHTFFGTTSYAATFGTN
jgi:hypothetical protein